MVEDKRSFKPQEKRKANRNMFGPIAKQTIGKNNQSLLEIPEEASSFTQQPLICL